VAATLKAQQRINIPKIGKHSITSQIPLRMLHPRNPPNRGNQKSQWKFKWARVKQLGFSLLRAIGVETTGCTDLSEHDFPIFSPPFLK